MIVSQLKAMAAPVMGFKQRATRNRSLSRARVRAIVRINQEWYDGCWFPYVWMEGRGMQGARVFTGPDFIGCFKVCIIKREDTYVMEWACAPVPLSMRNEYGLFTNF